MAAVEDTFLMERSENASCCHSASTPAIENSSSNDNTLSLLQKCRKRCIQYYIARSTVRSGRSWDSDGSTCLAKDNRLPIMEGRSKSFAKAAVESE